MAIERADVRAYAHGKRPDPPGDATGRDLPQRWARHDQPINAAD